MFKYIKAVFRGAYKILFAYPKIRKYAKNKDKYTLEERYGYAKKLINLVMKCFDVEICTEGLDKINFDEPFLLVCNHQGFMDALTIVHIFESKIIFVAKKETLKYPFAGKISEMMDTIFLDRENVKESVKMLRECKNSLNEGKIVGIFPEGTRTRDEDYRMGVYKAGAFKCAVDSKKKIVALCIDGGYKVLSTKYKGKVKINVSLVDIVDPSQYEGKNTGDIASELETKTRNKLEEIRKL